MKQNQNATSHTLLLHNADSRDLIHLSYAGLEVNACSQRNGVWTYYQGNPVQCHVPFHTTFAVERLLTCNR